MTVSRAHIRTTYLLAAMGFLSLMLTGEVPLYLMVLSTVSLFLSYDFERLTLAPKLPQAFWNTVALIFLFYEGFYAIFGRRELILNVAEFLMVVQIIRLWTRKEDRHYIQILGLSLLQLIAAAVLTADIVFAFVYIAYIVTGTWALVIFNLQKELKLFKGNPALEKRAVQMLTPHFFLVLSLISLGVFLFSIILFSFFPRLNYNYFSPLLNRGSATSGFSDQIRLGDMGQIKLDQKPVMRVTLSGEAARLIRPDNFYLRGMILNHYDGKKWKYIHTGKMTSVPVQTFDYVPLRNRGSDSYNLVQDIVTEPADKQVIFAVEKPVALRTPFGLITHVNGDNIMGIMSGGVRLKYSVRSNWHDFLDIAGPRRQGLKNSRQNIPYDPSQYKSFLQIPNHLDPRVVGLARDVTKKVQGSLLKAVTLDNYLKTRFTYSLKMADPGSADPIAYFLLQQKAGHCEYFAASLAVMLRTLGIPSRIVSGYYHGEWNEMGRFFLIRESHAHTWVEALVPTAEGTFVWTQFDPTPPDPTFVARSSILDRWQQSVDSMRLLWLNWVVDYDMQKQVNTVTTAYRKSKDLQKQTSINLLFLQNLLRNRIDFGEHQEIWVKRAFGLLSFLLIAGFLIRICRTWRRKSFAQAPIALPFYAKLLRILRKRGIDRPVHLTPWEFYELTVTQLGTSLGREGVVMLRELTNLFCRLRYGREGIDSVAEEKAKRLLKSLKETLKKNQA